MNFSAKTCLYIKAISVKIYNVELYKKKVDLPVLDYLREFNFVSVCFRLLLALVAGGASGYGRARKKQNAGLRTYMLVSVGAALTMLVSMYEYQMLTGQWASAVEAVGLKYDASRFSAQVVQGMGFLAAGTIIGIAHQQVSGLTTAIGLFTSAVLDLACGAGFYEAVIPTVFIIILALELMHPVEGSFKRRLRNIDIAIELTSLSEMSTVTDKVKSLGGQVFDIDIEGDEDKNGYSSAILSIKLAKDSPSHSSILSSLAELSCVYSIQELIS